MKADYERMIQSKTLQIENLEKRIIEYHKKQKHVNQVESEQSILASSIYNKFCEIPATEKPTLSDWKELRTVVNKTMPNLYATLVLQHKLSLSDFDVCMLLRLHFKPLEISNLTGLDKSTITTKRHRIYKKIFGRQDNGTEFMDYLIHLS